MAREVARMLHGGRRRNLVLAAACAALIAGAAAAGTRAESPTTAPGATAAASPTATALAAPTPTPWTPPPAAPARSAPPAGDWPGFGPVTADPVRVRTGDGDCLNVRYLPGLSGQGAPRECAAEGTLLWLWGEPADADGETWRYALGRGWVAVRFTEPAPGARQGFGPFASVTAVAGALGEWSQVAAADSGGTVSRSPWLPFNAGWSGVRPSPLSPSGRFVAAGQFDPDMAGGVVFDTATGAAAELNGALPVMWGPGDRLAVRIPAVCDGCPGGYGWTSPPFREVRPFAGPASWNLAWLPDGSGVVTWVPGAGLRVETLEGGERTIPLAVPPEEWPGELTVSPSGTKALLVPFTGPVRVVDLESGSVREFARPAPGFVGGRCGGSPGLTSAWADEETVAWHELLQGDGGNGIVVANLRTGERRVYPFVNVLDLRPAGAGLLTFTVQDYAGEKGELPAMSWLLDPRTGDAWPAAGGMFGQWR